MHSTELKTSPLKVFLIEDSAEIREILTQSIETNGEMRVVGYADNATNAIDSILTLDIDALIVDLNLREGSGLQVLSYLQKNGNPKSILLIVLTSHATPAFKRACEFLKADHILDKSMEFERVIEILTVRAAESSMC